MYATSPKATPPVPESGDRIGNWLQVHRHLHRSTRYDTVLATDIRSNAPVVAKLLRPDARNALRAAQRLRREALLTMSLHHPNLVHGTAWCAAPPYVLLEHVAGPTLRELLRVVGHMESCDVRDLAHQLVSALAYLHERSIIHADIKPANIMCDGTPGARRYVLVDFDLARRAGEPCSGVGTRLFMAPEHTQRSVRAHPAADLWGLGVVLFRALTGSLPFHAEEGAPQAVASAPPVLDRRPDADCTLAKLIDALLAPAPGDRPTLPECRRMLDFD